MSTAALAPLVRECLIIECTTINVVVAKRGQGDGGCRLSWQTSIVTRQ